MEKWVKRKSKEGWKEGNRVLVKQDMKSTKG